MQEWQLAEDDSSACSLKKKPTAGNMTPLPGPQKHDGGVSAFR